MDVLNRFVIHFFSSFGLYLLAFFSLRFAFRKLRWWRRWFGAVHQNRAAVAVWCLIWLGLWEGANTLGGQSEVYLLGINKLYWDFTSWALGLAVSTWAFQRYFFAVYEDM